MNPVHLIEPYSCWNKNPRKKHWIEQLEEEQMYYRMMQEQREIDKGTISDSAASAGSGAGSTQATTAGPAGAGGVPPYSYFNAPASTPPPEPEPEPGPAPVLPSYCVPPPFQSYILSKTISSPTII